MEQFKLNLEEGKHYYCYKGKKQFFNEILSWCDDNIRDGIWFEKERVGVFEFYSDVNFRNIADMIAFKLRWL